MYAREKQLEVLEAGTVKLSCGCHVWVKNSLPRGYGVISIGNQKQAYAHRVSYMLHKGPIPEGHVVMHTCDVPECVNPEHLVAGTQTDNMQDCKRKGRQNRPSFAGSRNGRAKFNETTALEAYRDPRSIKEIAATYGVTETSVRLLKGGKTWQHVTSAAKVAGLNTTAIHTDQD